MSRESAEVAILKSYPSPASTMEDAGEEVIYVEFEDGDRRNPLNYSRAKKWAITLTACLFAAITGAAASSFSISAPSMTAELHCTELQATLGLGLYALGFGVIPLVTSSFSEEVGRRPVYIFSTVLFTLTQVMVALAPNIGVVIAGRVLGGVFGSTGASLVGGSIADIWKPQERGIPMSLFAFSSLFSIGLGSVIGGVIESEPHLGWRWVQWIHVMVSFLFVVLVLIVMSETRSSIILTQMARSKRKITRDNRHKAKAEINKESLWSLIKTACSRPLYFLLTEPLVQSFSIWVGFTWGVVYCLLESVSPMFETVYGFNVRQTGYVYGALSVGAFIGFIANMYQDKLYRIHYAQKKQEARLYLACVAALCLPVGMLIVAWTASPKIHWMAPVIGLTVFMAGVMIIFHVAFLYLADCYNIYASSAQAGQSLFRNTMALVFPLLTPQLFTALTYRWGLTLVGVLAFLMAPTPFVLFFYGSKIRARSIASRQILAADAQASETSRPRVEKV
ncbi:Drug:H+ antiporter-1 family protein [Paxillus involutus ATCC 200175]|uniref:Drug:H+ antiporter-1 family protein n=1 Tax=Paxillus involutus ATCC 200175 TaxID=664439 RepID=A0A0C9SYN6_PAXIN|nr:Drug:H+ antiporter-1 family protein [Paxillus involutus ATCC 200175]